MRVESALYASQAGLTAHGQAIAVIGDNISNSNTNGFKGSRIEFEALLSEGVDGRQSYTLPPVGSGAATATVRTLFEDGIIEATGRELDVAIDGRGFLLTGTAENPSLTRGGNLTISEDGLLSTGTGVPILGFQGTSTTLGTINMRSFSTGGVATSQASLIGNLSSGLAAKAAPASPGSFSDLGQQAHYVTSLTVYDSLGTPRDVTMAFTKTGQSTWTAQAYINGSDLNGGTEGVPVLLGSTTMSFQPDGTIAEASRAGLNITAQPNFADGAAQGNFTINLGSFTQYGATSQVVSISQNGQGSGSIQRYEFDPDGKIFAQLSSGSRVQVGTIQLGDVPNRDGLQRSGDGSFILGETAGDLVIGNPGVSGLGSIRGGMLERSTVDIANEFVNMVVFQRGYQANSQTLNAANEILRDTLNLIR